METKNLGITCFLIKLTNFFVPCTNILYTCMYYIFDVHFLCRMTLTAMNDIISDNHYYYTCTFINIK